MERPEDRWFVRWRTAGDADALARVYDTAAPALLRIALHHVRVPAAAEDLVQATFLAAIENAASYDPARPLLGWLVGILHNQAKWAARGERRVVDAARLREREVDDPLAAAQAAEFTAQVDDGIEQLPEIYRPVLRLHLAHELSAAAIAHALARPPGTVRAQIVRGLELLRALLPAGTALGAFAALAPARSAATLREAVLMAGRAHAATAATTSIAVATTALATTMATKKIVLGAALVLAVSALAWLLGLFGADAATDAPRAVPRAAIATDVAATPGPVPGAGPGPAVATERREVVVGGAIGWRLRGVVTGVGGEPVADARIRAAMLCAGEELAFATQTTDAQGRYDLDLGEARAWPAIDRERAAVWLAVDATAYVPFAAQLALPHHDPERAMVLAGDAQLEPGAIASGRVVDAEGRAVARASVSLRSAAGTDEAGRSTTTDGEGRFRIASLAAGAATILAEHDGHGAGECSCEVASGRDTTVPDVVLRPRSSLRMRVTFADGEPAVGQRVVIRRPGSEDEIAAVTTDREGRAALATLAPGNYVCAVRSDADFQDAAAQEVAAGDSEAHLVLRDLHQVRFGFVDDEGRPLRPLRVFVSVWLAAHGASLAAYAAGVPLPSQVEEDCTSIAGDVETMLVPRGSWLRVEANHLDALGQQLLHAQPPGNVHEVVVVMRALVRNATLRLRVLASDGGPLGLLEFGLHPEQLGAPDASDTRSTRDGEDRLCAWYPGRYRLEVRPGWLGEHFGWFAPFTESIELVGGRETLREHRVVAGGRVRFRLQAANVEHGHVAGFAVDAGGLADASPPGWRHRFLRGRGDEWVMMGSVPPGERLLWPPVLPPGTHRLVLRSRDHHDEVVTVAITPRTVTDVDVTLRAR